MQSFLFKSIIQILFYLLVDVEYCLYYYKFVFTKVLKRLIMVNVEDLS